MPEVKAKIARLREYLKAEELDGIVIQTRDNFAWVTGGGDNHVVSQSETGVAALYITARQAVLIANTIEEPRLTAEEPVAAFTVKSHPWTTPMAEAVAKQVGKKKVVCDVPCGLGLDPLPASFYELRAALTDEEVKRYKALGRDCAMIVETVARGMNIGDSGHQVEAELARHLLARGIQPHVLLVAFDDRLRKYRHPTPTVNHLRHYAMLVVCGRRYGLIANLTRLLHFGPVPADIKERHHAVCRVEAALWQHTLPGKAYGEVLQAGIEQYKKEGFAKEWQLHHQGGPTGFTGRDFLVTPDETRPVVDGQAVAWNPSIAGAKNEDTFILQGEERLVVTACSKNWPQQEIAMPGGFRIKRPGILER